MTIDYKKSFEKLVEQIRLERKWSNEEFDKLGGDDAEVINTLEQYNMRIYYRGMRSAYRSIDELAELLEKGEFDFGD